MSQLLWDLIRTIFGSPSEVKLDTQILQLYSRVSSRVFLVCSVLLTVRQMIGEYDIMCYDNGRDKDEILNAFCWISTNLYSVTEYNHNCAVKNDCIYPGIGQLKPFHVTQIHSYYQWTQASLYFQAFLFFLPGFLWRFWENGLQKQLSFDKKLLFYPIIPCEEAEINHKEHFKNLVTYFKSHRGTLHHQSYFFKYCGCELLGFVATAVNIVLIEVLLGFRFLSYGSDVVSYWWGSREWEDPEDVSPMIKVFPLMSKCFPPRRYGPGGNIVTKDPICILPLNALNDKIYLFLWFYLMILFFLSALSFLYRLSTLFFIPVRRILLKKRVGKIKDKVVDDLCNRGSVGDWFVFCILSKNVSTIFLKELLEANWELLMERKMSV